MSMPNFPLMNQTFHLNNSIEYCDPQRQEFNSDYQHYNFPNQTFCSNLPNYAYNAHYPHSSFSSGMGMAFNGSSKSDSTKQT